MNFIIRDEKWTPITGKSVPFIRDGYLISTHGRVYDTINNVEPKIYSNQGYNNTVVEQYDGTKVFIAIHRVEMIEFKYVDGCYNMDVDHIDCNRGNNYIGNLEWVTRQENIIRAHNNNRCAIGEDYYKSIFTNEEVEKICELLSKHTPIKEIASIMEKEIYPREYKNMVSTIYGIYNKECWKSISDKYDIPSYNDYNFTDEQVHFICKCFEEDLSYDEIMDKLDIKESDVGTTKYNNYKNTMSNIRTGRNYSNISSNYDFERVIDRRAFTEEQVNDICKYIVEGLDNSDVLSKIYSADYIDSLDKSTRKKLLGNIRDIRRGKTRKDISSKYFGKSSTTSSSNVELK